MKGLLRKAVTTGLFWVARNYEKVSLDLAKIEAVSLYVKTIRDVRMVVIALIGLIVVSILLVGSFLGLLAAIVFILPITAFAKALALLITMGVLFLFTLIGVLVVISERMWMKKSKASDMVEKTAGRILRHRHA